MSAIGMPPGSFARKGFLLSVGAELVVVICSIVNYATIDGDFFNINTEYGFAGGIGALVFAAAAVAAVLAARRDCGERKFWLAIAAISAALAVETLVGVHHVIEDIGGLYYWAMGAYIVIGAIALGFILLSVRLISAPAPLLLGLAVLLFLLAQVFAAINSVAGDLPSAPNAVLTIAEEWGEMLMASFVLAAALSVLDRLGAGAAEQAANNDASATISG